jgi:hypothetical protein
LAPADVKRIEGQRNADRDLIHPRRPGAVVREPSERKQQYPASNAARLDRHERVMDPSPGTDAEDRTRDAPTLIAEIDGELVEAIARRVIDLLKPELAAGERDRLATAGEIAREFRVERDWVYAHADALGALRLGDGQKPRLRFDRSRARQALATLGAPVKPGPPGRRGGPRRKIRDETLLPIYGQPTGH